MTPKVEAGALNFKKLFRLCLLFSAPVIFMQLAAIHVFAKSTENVTVLIKINDVQFYLHGHGRNSFVTMEELREFENTFQEIQQQVFDQLNVKAPNGQRVHIAENASVFGSLTHKNWYVAALYDPDSDSYYFQNIKSLARQNILSKSLAHEACHHAIFIERGKSAAGDFQVIDESFCQALYPVSLAVGSPETNTSNYQTTAYSSFTRWKLALKNSMNSLAKEEVYWAYRQVQSWGNYVIETQGLLQALALTTAGDDTAFEKIFRDFKKRRGDLSVP